MTEPIRIAQVMGKMVGGGVEQVVMNYYRHIDRLKVQFDFLVDDDSTLVPKDEIEALGGRVFFIPPYQKITSYQSELVKLFKRENWDIVHSHINTLSVFSLRAAKIADVPVRIAHSHATMGKGETIRNVVKIALRLFANVYPTTRVACSEYSGRWLFGEKYPFTVIPNALEIPKFRTDTSKRSGIRRAWNVGVDCCVVGNLGRIESAKNQSFLIDVFSQLHAHHINSHLVIVGCGSLRISLEQKVCNLGLKDCVHFLGQIDDVSGLYQGMDVFVFPSLYEGFGMALLEAQISEVPCVASNRVSSEVVISDACELLPLEAGVDVWADAIWEKFSNGARAAVGPEVLEHFDIEAASKKLCSFYLDLIKD